MQKIIIISLLAVIALGVSYFVYQDYSEKRAIEKAKIERENAIKERERQKQLTEERRKKESGKCYELWKQDYFTISYIKGKAEDGFDKWDHPNQAKLDLVELYKECGDRPESW